MSLPGYRYRGEPDTDERGGPSDNDYDNGPRPLPDQSFMPDNPNNRPLPNPNLGTDQDTADWIAANVYPNGWTVDGKTMEIIDPDTGEIKGRVPTLYPRT